MNHEQKMTCDDFTSLLIKKTTGELLPVEKDFLEAHLAYCASCASDEQELSRAWNRYGDLPLPEIPIELYEKTRERILGQLRQEKALFPWTERIPMKGIWSLLIPFAAGLAMTGVSYALIRSLIDLRIHHQHILITLFSLWGLLFAGGFWLILQGKRKKTILLDVVASFSISITFLVLLISYLASGVDALRWLAMSAAYEVAVASNYFFDIGNTFVAGWGIYACLASFIGAFIFGVRRGPAFSQNALLGSFLITVLLSPAIYLHGSSHDHGYGILAFGVLGTFVGAFIGVGIGSMGSFILRRILTPAT